MAGEFIRTLVIDEYFLYPEIDWQPKSESIKKIQENLNIGLDSIAFIDDSNFERAEVSEILPEVLCVDAVNYANLLYYPCFEGSISADSKKRRLYYQAEGKRRTELETKFQSDYTLFLRNCNIKLTISQPNKENFTRINDLIQRTNQMNFSGNRYTREEVSNILENADFDKYVLSASDRFGNYGIIGFAVVEKNSGLVTDMLFSCRVQMKRIEHAFLCNMLQKYKDRNLSEFRVVYCPNKRNSQCAKIFEDLGFEKVNEVKGPHIFSFDFKKTIPRETIVDVLGDE